MPGIFGSQILGVALLATVLGATSVGAGPTDSIDRAMEATPTVSGQSAYARMKACGIEITESSFTEFGPDSGIPAQAKTGRWHFGVGAYSAAYPRPKLF